MKKQRERLKELGLEGGREVDIWGIHALGVFKRYSYRKHYIRPTK